MEKLIETYLRKEGIEVDKFIAKVILDYFKDAPFSAGDLDYLYEKKIESRHINEIEQILQKYWQIGSAGGYPSSPSEK